MFFVACMGLFPRHSIVTGLTVTSMCTFEMSYTITWFLKCKVIIFQNIGLVKTGLSCLLSSLLGGLKSCCKLLRCNLTIEGMIMMSKSEVHQLTRLPLPCPDGPFPGL